MTGKTTKTKKNPFSDYVYNFGLCTNYKVIGICVLHILQIIFQCIFLSLYLPTLAYILFRDSFWKVVPSCTHYHPKLAVSSLWGFSKILLGSSLKSIYEINVQMSIYGHSISGGRKESMTSSSKQLLVVTVISKKSGREGDESQTFF